MAGGSARPDPPCVGDLDGDGAAEAAWPSEDLLSVYERDGSGWRGAGPTWGVHDFTITNLQNDGTVPAPPEPSWLTCNVLRARTACDDLAQADLRVEVVDQCVADCTYGPVQVGVQVSNHGAGPAVGATLRLYAEDDSGPRLVGTMALPDVPGGTALAGVAFELSPADVGCCGWTATVDEDDVVFECDETNNTSTYADSVCP